MSGPPETPLDFFGNPVDTFGPTGNCSLANCPIEYSIYQYKPSLGANYTLIAIFGLAIVVHAYLGFRWKSWWFMSCMIIGCIAEIIGYTARVLLHDNPFGFDAFLTQIVCITTAPVFFCAGIYVTLAKAVVYFDESLSRIPPKLYYWIFIICDLISLVLQGSGGALSTVSDGPDDNTGVVLAMAGLGFQVATLCFFCFFFGDFLFRYFRELRANGQAVGWRVITFFSFMSLGVALILARSAYRVKELEDGYDGELVHDELLFVILEGGLVALAVFALCLGHPGIVFGKAESEQRRSKFSEEDGECSGLSTEMESY